MKIILVLLVLLSVETSYAWGRLGHSIIGTTAAYLISDETNEPFFKSHSFDIGYYANTPDFIWKEPATVERERPQHYVNKEIFDRALKNYKGPDPYALSREEFDSKFPEIPQDAGRAWWRVRELNDLFTATTKKLHQSVLSKDQRFENQANWLLLAGVIGHYVGDLGMPLHVSENHDGQLTGQEGIHAFFEDTVVDELYGSLQQKVITEARKRWGFFHKQHSPKSILELLKEMSLVSYNDVGELLKIDKKIGHKDVKKGAQAYRAMIEERVTVASLFLAEILVRQTNFKPDNKRFFTFISHAPYIELGKAAQLPALGQESDPTKISNGK